MAAPGTIQMVKFGLNGDAENRANSYVEVTSYELFTQRGEPVDGGVYSLQMGTTDHAFNCATCGQGKRACPGHRGHLELRAGVIQPVGVAEVRKWLRVVCHRCGAPLVEPEKFANVAPSARLAAAAASAAEGRACGACGAVAPRVLREADDNFGFRVEDAGARPPAPGEPRGDRLPPDAIAAILARITPATVAAFGRAAGARPDQLVLRAVNVPPNTIRPGVRSYGGAGSSYHDSTNLLQHLVKRNAALPAARDGAGASEAALQNLGEQYYALVMGSSAASAAGGSRHAIVVGSRPLHSFLRNLPRKEGRIRGNLFGKRVVFTARTTIGGSSDARVDEVVIPLAYARTLQVEETVAPHNITALAALYANGRRAYPGCTQLVRRETGARHDVAALRDTPLEVGDVLVRDVVNGDLAYFGRQPSLERSSLGVHRVVVNLDPAMMTFQMNVLACEWYNADFDGDQMLLWVARGAAARAEAGVSSAVANWFVSTKTGGPVTGQHQDSVVGAHGLTLASTRIAPPQAMVLFAGARRPPRFDVATPPVLTGRDVASRLLAATPIDYRGTPSSYREAYAAAIGYDPRNTSTTIRRGVVDGVLDTAAIGHGKRGGLFDLIGREYGNQRALDAVFEFQQVMLRFIAARGLTIAAADALPAASAVAAAVGVYLAAAAEARAVAARLARGAVVPPIGETVRSFYEKLALNALRPDGAPAVDALLRGLRPGTGAGAGNGFLEMMLSGSTGKVENLTSVCAATGQMTVSGDRAPAKFGLGRTLPWFARYETDPIASGFSTAGYMAGPGAAEYFLSSMQARHDLITKALTTAVTGYFMRKGAVSNQSTVVDNFRRLAKDRRILQFVYGADGIDPRRLEIVKLRTVFLDDAALAARAANGVPAAALADPAGRTAVDAAAAALRADRDLVRAAALAAEAAGLTVKSAVSESVAVPVDVARVIAGVIAARPAGAAPAEVSGHVLAARTAAVEALARALPAAFSNPTRAARGDLPAPMRAAPALLAAIVRAELTPGTAAGMTDPELDFIAVEIRLRYAAALIDSGTAAGVIAAQALCEPLTQYMLDSHHRSVAGGTSTRSTLARVNELFGARAPADELAPVMRALVAGAPPAGAAGAPAAAAAAALTAELEFARVVATHDVLLESPDQLTFPPTAGDAAFLAAFLRDHPLARPPADLTRWCFRFELDRGVLALKHLPLELAARKLRGRHPGFWFAHSAEAAPTIVVRAWARAAAFRGRADAEARARELLAELFATPLRGVPRVASAESVEVVRHVAAADGSLAAGKRWAVRTAGTNLADFLLCRAIDPATAVSSSVGDTLRCFGAEAACDRFRAECLSFLDDKAPIARHADVYAFDLFAGGRQSSIERAGVREREPSNVLLHAAYADPIRALQDAALRGARQPVYGIAAPVMLGATPRIGSQWNSFTVDAAYVRANSASLDTILDDI